MRSPFLALLAVGCTAAEAPFLDEIPLEVALADAEPGPETSGALRRVITFTSSPLIPGDEVTFTIFGANPNEQVDVARSLAGPGNGPCLGTAQALCLDIVSPAIQGSATADAAGVATLVQTLPTSVPIGRDVAFQALIRRGVSGVSWVKTNVLEVTTSDAPLPVAAMVPGDLVVTEVMQNPAAVSDAAGEWFEVKNVTELDMNLAGLEVTDFAGDSFTVGTTVFLPAGGFAVFARNADPGLNGGVVPDFAYSGMDLANDVDEIHLVAGATIIDSVAWDNGVSFPDPVGASMELSSSRLNAADNDAGIHWSAAVDPFGLGDLGTPGAVPPISCDPTTEVAHQGRCYYLDGSGGRCEADYELAPQSILSTIGASFAGLDYKTTISSNCCVSHADQAIELQDFGMDFGDCNAPGPFTFGPVPGGSNCNNSLSNDLLQLTLCQSR